MKVSKFPILLLVLLLTAALFGACGGDGNNDSGDLSYEEGTSPADDIVNATPADKVILVVSFGTSFNLSRSMDIGGLEQAIQEAYPDYQVRRAFSSQIIIDKLEARDGLKIDNVEGALNRLVIDKVKEVIIQPTTIMTGAEYDEVMEQALPFADKFESFKIGNPLLTDEGDYDAVAEVLVAATQQYRGEGTALVFMGHGTHHEANSTYAKFQTVLAGRGDTDYVIGTVEAEPALEDVQAALEAMGIKKAVLSPFMIVAGDHANNDMAGDEEDSWKTVLAEDGYEIEIVMEGLGRKKGIQDIFIKHIQDAMNGEGIKGQAQAEPLGLTADRIKDGSYSIEVDSDSAMFKVVECKLTVAGDEMTAVVTLSGQGFENIYMGTVDQAEKDPDGQADFVLTGERHSFTVAVAALDKELPAAAKGVKSGKWYDHILVFESRLLPKDSIEEKQIDVTMSGGTGRASIHSPAKLIYKDGQDFASIVWSSEKYIYMIVDGVEYLPLTTEGGSNFEIPVKLNMETKVVACTVAMSEPHEIEYSLFFDGASIK